MEAKMMMPANYCVMSEEEMTYTEGGATPYRLSALGLFLSMAGIRVLPLSAIIVKRILKLGQKPAWMP